MIRLADNSIDWEAMFRRCHKLVCYRAHAAGLGRLDVEDVAQNTWLEAWRTRERWDWECPERILSHLASRQAVNQLRRIVGQGKKRRAVLNNFDNEVFNIGDGQLSPDWDAILTETITAGRREGKHR